MIPRCVRSTGQTMGRPRPGRALQTPANPAKLRPRLSTDFQKRSGVNRFATSQDGSVIPVNWGYGVWNVHRKVKSEETTAPGKTAQNHAGVRMVRIIIITIIMIMIIISVREFRLNNLKSSREIDWDFRNDFSSTRSKHVRNING